MLMCSVKQLNYIAFLLFLTFCLLQTKQAEGQELVVVDQNGSPVANAVVVVPGVEPEKARVKNEGVLSQSDLEFSPEVLAIFQGDLVSFPNLDDVKHHVYSFSKARTFELQLYEGKEHESVLFDKPGLVVIGCNIHDHMQAYIFISEDPVFAMTDAAGVARLDTTTKVDSRTLLVWHPRITDNTKPVEKVAESMNGLLNINLDLTRPTVEKKQRAKKRYKYKRK